MLQQILKQITLYLLLWEIDFLVQELKIWRMLKYLKLFFWLIQIITIFFLNTWWTFLIWIWLDEISIKLLRLCQDYFSVPLNYPCNQWLQELRQNIFNGQKWKFCMKKLNLASPTTGKFHYWWHFQKYLIKLCIRY